MDDEKVSEFVAATNSDAETAKFYLEACGGDVSSALESYFANADAPTQPHPQPQQSSQPRSAVLSVFEVMLVERDFGFR